jgi:endogenous inhibitor of DNA gyrase (YacG/DUF329 family)
MTKKLMKGGSSCGAPVEKKMTGGSKKKSKGSKKSSKSTLGTTEARCLKCGKNVTISNPKMKEIKTSKRVMKMMQGTCPVCGTKVNRIVGN